MTPDSDQTRPTTAHNVCAPTELHAPIISPLTTVSLASSRTSQIDHSLLEVNLGGLDILSAQKQIEFLTLAKKLTIGAGWVSTAAAVPGILILLNVVNPGISGAATLLLGSSLLLIVSREVRNIAGLVRVFAEETDHLCEPEVGSARTIVSRSRQLNNLLATLDNVSVALNREDYSRQGMKEAIAVFQDSASPPWLSTNLKEAIRLLKYDLNHLAMKDSDSEERSVCVNNLSELKSILITAQENEQSEVLKRLSTVRAQLAEICPDRWTLVKLWRELKERRLSARSYKPEHLRRSQRLTG